MKKIVFSTILTLVLLSLHKPAAGEPLSDEKLHKFLKRIQSAAKDEGISDLEHALFRLSVRMQNYSIGSVAPINGELYARATKSTNGLIIQEKNWSGLPSSQSQLVVIQNGQVLNSFKGIDCTGATLVMFCPTEIQFIDLKNQKAGFFKRPKPEEMDNDD